MTGDKVIELDGKEQELICELVEHYKNNQSLVSNFFKSMLVYIDESGQSRKPIRFAHEFKTQITCATN